MGLGGGLCSSHIISALSSNSETMPRDPLAEMMAEGCRGLEEKWTLGRTIEKHGEETVSLIIKIKIISNIEDVSIMGYHKCILFSPGKVPSNCSLGQSPCFVIWMKQWRISGQVQRLKLQVKKKSIHATLTQLGEGLSKVKKWVTPTR